MLKINRRNLLASVAAVAVVESTVDARAYLSRRPSNGSITSITLVNTSQNTVAAGSVTQLIGCPFKKGDLKKGTWPQFQLQGGTTVPATLLNSLATRWSDGSLKFVPAMLSIPQSISGNGSLTVNILSANFLPQKSPRGLKDFTANGLDIQVQVDGLDNLSGTWIMDLKTALGSKTKVVSYGNGAAGAVWKIRAPAQQKGVNHGQLVCDYYIASLANPDGSLKGLRILGKVKLPYYDTTQTMNWMSFSRFQLLQNSKGKLIRDCFGTNFGSARAYAFAWSEGPVFAANHGYSTANNHDYSYCTRFTTTGVLPTGLAAKTSYFTAQNPFSATTIGFSTNSGGQSAVSATDDGVGTHTATPYPYLSYFGATFTAGAGGMWDFVQGGGSDQADTPVRCEMNPEYWVSTGLLPPYDITTKAVSNGPTSYWPNSAEPAVRFLSTTGERDDLGIMPAWYARHFLTQAAIDEQVVRVMSLVGGQLAIGLESSATGTYPCVNNGSNGAGQAYPGMPAPNPNFYWAPNEGTTKGFPNGDTTNPNVRMAAFSQQDTTHMPQFNYYPYLFSGEPWHLDMLLEHANNAVYSRLTPVGVANISATSFSLGANGGGVRNLTVGTNPTFTGITIGDAAGQQRTDAWGSALLAAAAAICPDQHPECTSYKQYFGQMNSATWTAAVGVINALPSFAQSIGLWSTPPQGGSTVTVPWEMAYLGAAIGLACTATENKNAQSALQSHVKWFDYVVSKFGGWHAGTFHALVKTANNAGAPLVSSAAGIAFEGPTFNWTAGGHFTLIPFSNYTPTDGDKVLFGDSVGTDVKITPAGFANYVPYYMGNINGDQFDLATNPGGGAIPLTDSYDGNDTFYIVSTEPPAIGSMDAIGNPSCYNAEILGMLNYALAAGVKVNSGTISDLSYRNQQAGTNYASNPKWGFTNTFFQ
jgi:hypothetical protein